MFEKVYISLVNFMFGPAVSLALVLIISVFPFLVFRSLVFVGYRKGLEEKDLWELNPRDMTRTAAPAFQKEWEKEMTRCGM